MRFYRINHSYKWRHTSSFFRQIKLRDMFTVQLWYPLTRHCMCSSKARFSKHISHFPQICWRDNGLIFFYVEDSRMTSSVACNMTFRTFKKVQVKWWVLFHECVQVMWTKRWGVCVREAVPATKAAGLTLRTEPFGSFLCLLAAG